jgi:hypothetical protein
MWVDPGDIVPDSFGPGLPLIRDWTERHYDFAGYVTPASIGYLITGTTDPQWLTLFRAEQPERAHPVGRSPESSARRGRLAPLLTAVNGMLMAR